MQSANRRLRAEAALRDVPIIGTTIVALLASGRHCACLWAGDSRIYLFRAGRLKRLTRDHSQIEAVLSRRHTGSDDTLLRPPANLITRALGAEDTAGDRLHHRRGRRRRCLPAVQRWPEQRGQRTGHRAGAAAWQLPASLAGTDRPGAASAAGTTTSRQWWSAPRTCTALTAPRCFRCCETWRRGNAEWPQLAPSRGDEFAWRLSLARMPCFLSSVCRWERFMSQRLASSVTTPPTSCKPRSRNSRSA